MNDELPLHCVASSAEPEVLQWILDEHFEGETLLKFNMIAARNKFGNSCLAELEVSKELEDFFGEKLIEYMSELDFEEKDFVERMPLIELSFIQ